MEEERHEETQRTDSTGTDLREVIQGTIREYLSLARAESEPANQTELKEERRRREQLERRVNELVAENDRSRRMAEETDRNATIRDELRKLGVKKVELGFRAVKDDVFRTEDGRLMARGEEGETTLSDYLARFTQQNPELLPARIPGGSGATGSPEGQTQQSFSLESIKPGMDPEKLGQIRQEIAQVISNTFNK